MEELKFDNQGDTLDLYGELVEQGLSLVGSNNQRKTIEVCHASKLLLMLSDLSFHQVDESPDFVLKTRSGERIGLEHEVLLDSDFKRVEGSFQELFKSVEKEIRRKHPKEKALMNIYVNRSFPILKKNRSRDLKDITSLVEKYLLMDEFVPTEIVDQISKMPHSRFAISTNTGGWWGERYITKEMVDMAVAKKSAKLDKYKSNSSTQRQWLLIVIGGARESSYEVDRTQVLRIAKNEFERVYILEDFNFRVFRAT